MNTDTKERQQRLRIAVDELLGCFTAEARSCFTGTGQECRELADLIGNFHREIHRNLLTLQGRLNGHAFGRD